MRVLVIEDDAGLAESFVDVLQDEGYDVDTASDGSVGLEVLRRASALPDVILLDLMMPNMDGQLFRINQLSEPCLASIPTIVLTGQPVTASTKAALGPMPVMTKPVSLATLLAAIAEVLAPEDRAKRCSCGRVYNEETWHALTFVGEIDNGRDAGERFELRQCACRSTLAWQLGRHAISVPSPF